MATAKKQTKQDLENKIAELEAKLDRLSDQLQSKPAETAKPKPTLPKGSTPKPAETKPAQTTKPKGTLPKGFEVKEAPKPAETKPAKTTQPTTVQAALENAYMNAPMTDLHHYRASTTGYTPAPNRYFVRKTAPVGTVPTKNWNDQKVTVTGYTAVSNQYFATRARMAYHPADKTFGTFSGVNMSIKGLVEQTTSETAPEPAKPKASKGTLPKGFEDAPKIEAPKASKGTLPKGF